MTVTELEAQVWAIESVRIVVRARGSTEVDDYSYKRSAQDTWRVGQWLDKRVRPLIGNREVTVGQGDGEEPHGRVILRTLRSSYYGS